MIVSVVTNTGVANCPAVFYFADADTAREKFLEQYPNGYYINVVEIEAVNGFELRDDGNIVPI